MLASLFARRIGALVVALGLLLSGAAPALSAPASSDNTMPGMTMNMPGMVMDNSGMGAGKATPDRRSPCKDCDNGCAIGASCAGNIALMLDLVPVPFPSYRNVGLIGPDAAPDGIASPPALPPPILAA
jgi:hypothetical protein